MQPKKELTNEQVESLNDALSMVSFHGHAEVVKLLIKAGADVTAKDNDPICLAIENGHAEVVKLLIKAGAGKEK